ncbi:MAG: histidine kinase [Spirochaetia bacterium]|nr:histidine kinase [Spirochaetia bacterium]
MNIERWKPIFYFWQFLQNRKVLFLTAFSVFIFLYIPESSAANPAVRLSESDSTGDLSSYLYFHEDPDGKMNFAEVSGESVIWKKNEMSYPAFGFTGSAIWGYFDVHNPSDKEIEKYLIFEFPLLDEIQIYHKKDSGIITEYKSGAGIPAVEKPLDFRLHAIPLVFSPGTSSRIYFRIVTKDTFELPIILLKDQELIDKFFYENLFIAFYYGLLLVMLFYNLFIYIGVRDRSYLYYSGFTFCVGLVQAGNQGFIAYFLFPANPLLQNMTMAAAGNGGIIFIILLIRSFLNLKQENSILYRMSRYLLGISSALFIITVLNYNWIILSMVWAILINIFFLFSAMKNYNQSIHARFFFWGIFAALLGVLSFTLKGVNVVHPNLSRYEMIYGHSSELILISLALAVRIRYIQKEQEKANLKEQDLKLQMKEQELNRQKLQLAGIKKIIKPQFLISLLDLTIKKIKTNPKEAVDLIYTISDEFRYITENSKNKIISSESELSICREHLTLMEQLKNKKYSLSASGFTPQFTIPPMLIHTFIEETIFSEDKQSKGIAFEVKLKINNQNPKKKNENDTPQNAWVLTLTGKGNFINTESIQDTGRMYMETALEEAFPGRWQIDQKENLSEKKIIFSILTD